MLEKLQGVVIKTQDYQESHKIVTIFSGKLGKFSAIARGANKYKSRMAAVTQPFIYGDFVIYVGRGLSTLQQGDMINSFRSIREDIFKTAYVAYMMELSDKLLEQKQPHIHLYNEFMETLNWIENYDGDQRQMEIPMMMYELKLYTYAGFAPVVDTCVSCGNENSPPGVFSITYGGLLCKNCMKKDHAAHKVSPSLARLLRIFKHVDFENIRNISMRPENIAFLRQLFNLYYDTYGS